MIHDLYAQLRPELLTLGAALLILLVDLLRAPARLPAGRQAGRRWIGWLSGLLALGLVSVVWGRWQELSSPVHLWGGVVTLDRLGLVFKAIFLLGVAIASVGSVDYAARHFRHVGEYYALLFFSALGMMFMASAGDLITLYLGLEMATLSLYVLCSFAKDSPRSGEAGLKYIILGATASAVYLYGSSLIYGVAGTTQFRVVGATISWFGVAPGLIVGGIFVLAAFGFKIAAVPFHMWAPDVYQGAPTPVTGFLATASKAAGFAALVRVFLGPMLDASSAWLIFVVALSALSMAVGNLLALSQTDIKRMLAYSGIAQAGYALVGVAATSAVGTMATAFFLFQYLFTNLGAFLVVTAVGSTEGNDQISGYNGLSRRSPVLAAGLLVLLLSLGGIPPMAGFWAKLFVFWAAVNRGLYGLVFIGVLTSVMSLYYYLQVARAMYIEAPGEKPSVRLTPPIAAAIIICVLAVIGLVYPQPLLNLVHDAAARWF